MLKLAILLAQIDLEHVIPEPSRNARSNIRDILLILGATFLVAVLLFLWAFFLRKRHSTRRHHRSHKHGHSHSRTNGHTHDVAEADIVTPELTEEEPELPTPADHSHRRRRRRRKKRPGHPDNRPRNPTLAETGGLPPVRPEESEEPSQPML